MSGSADCAGPCLHPLLLSRHQPATSRTLRRRVWKVLSRDVMSWVEKLLSSARYGAELAEGIVVGVGGVIVIAGTDAAEYIPGTWNTSLLRRTWSRRPRLLSDPCALFSIRKLTGGRGYFHKMPYSAPGMSCPSPPWEVSEDHSLDRSSRGPCSVLVRIRDVACLFADLCFSVRWSTFGGCGSRNIDRSGLQVMVGRRRRIGSRAGEKNLSDT